MINGFLPQAIALLGILKSSILIEPIDLIDLIEWNKKSFFTTILNSQSPRNVQILVGTNNLGKGGTYYKVEKLIAHEDYNNPQFAFDIAVIRIRGKIEFNKKVQTIELGKEEVPDDAEVRLTGWGRLRVRFFTPCKN